MDGHALNVEHSLKKRVLIVDDIRTDLYLIGKLVTGFGHEAILSDSAFQAFDFIDESIDLVIIDAIMPDIDGFEFVKTMRKRYSFNIPTIMITSLSGREDRIRAIEAGVNDFVSKPVDKVELRVRINSMLKMKAAQDKVRQYQQELEKLVAQKTSDLSIALKKLYAVHNSMNDCMLILDRNSEITEANKAFIDLTGFSEFAEIKGYNFISLLENESQREAFQGLLSSDGITNQTDLDFPQWNNRVFSIMVTHLENDSHVLVMRDITEKALADEQRAQLLSLLSHELRTPLNGIKGFTSLITDEKDLLTDEHCDYFESIDSCCDQLEIIVNEILNFVQLVNNHEELEEKQIDLEPVLEKVLREHSNEQLTRNIRIFTHVEADDPHIYCKEKHIYEVFRQIISNAIRFSNDQSHIDIQILSGEKMIKFICMDNGIGIPRESLNRVFDSFYQIENYSTRTKPGLGLGLTITRRIVDMYNGSIDIESNPGEGTTVTVKFPAG